MSASAGPLAGRAALGAFRVVGELGRGGTAWVYAVEREGRRFALKLPELAQALSPRGEERLAREARIAGDLADPGVVRLVESGQVEGRPYLLYELVEGARTLDLAWAEAGLVQRVRWVREAAAAAGVAHARGVVHRDLKPENVLVDSSGRARITDFGVGWIANERALTRTGEVIGTPLNLAPEQWVEGTAATSPAVDVWALGLLLYRALTGAHPFARASLRTLLAEAEQGVTPPSQLRPELAPELDAICLRALAPAPASRFSDGTELARALDGWLARAPQDASPGPPRVAGFQLLERLGAGAQGAVYRAREEGLGREVALKLLAVPSGDEGQRALKRFAVEAEAACRVSHPGLVRVHASGRAADGRPYLVTELIEGRPLGDLLGQLEPRAAVELLVPVAQALATLHAAGIVHRDVKPENVLVDAAGRARLTDFGVARLELSVDRLTQTGQSLGTPLYMAPEQLGGARHADGRADVYALGATLYHLVSGDPPADGATLMALASAKQKAPPPPQRTDAALAAICLRCLAPSPHRRYPSAQALADDLERYLQGQARAPRARRGLALAAGLALVGLAGLGWAAWGRGEEPAGSRRRVLDVDPRELLGRGLRRLAEGEEVEELLAEFPSESLEADALEGARAVLGPEPRQAGRRLRRVRIKGLKHPALLGLEAVGRARSGGQPDAAGDLALLDALGAAWAARPAVREARARTLRELGRLSEAVEALGANAPALAAALLTELADRALTQGELEAAATWVEDARFDPAAAPERVATLGGLTEQRFEAALVTGERAQTSSDPSWLLAAAACLRIQRALRPDFALPPEQVRRFCDLAPRWVSGNTTEAFRTLHAQVLACVADEPAELLAEVVVQDAPYRPDQAAVVLAHLRRALAGLQGGLADLLRTREVELLATVDPGQARAAASVALERIEDPSLREVLRVQRARAANRLGLHQEALGDVEGSTSAQARIQQAYACLGLGRGDDAARAAGALLETGLVANTFAHNAAKHAWQAFGLGSREPARAALARYAELSGARPEGLVHAAAAHWACDQREAARELLARSDRHQPGLVPAGLLEALEQDPDPAGAWLLRWAKSVGEP